MDPEDRSVQLADDLIEVRIVKQAADRVQLDPPGRDPEERVDIAQDPDRWSEPLRRAPQQSRHRGGGGVNQEQRHGGRPLRDQDRPDDGDDCVVGRRDAVDQPDPVYGCHRASGARGPVGRFQRRFNRVVHVIVCLL